MKLKQNLETFLVKDPNFLLQTSVFLAMFIHLNIKVFGRVQGVLFRQSTAYKAEELGITGFVRNDYDGSVYLEVEGKRDILDKFVVWCRRGPSFAKVTKVEVVESSLQKFSGFVIEG